MADGGSLGGQGNGLSPAVGPPRRRLSYRWWVGHLSAAAAVVPPSLTVVPTPSLVDGVPAPQGTEESCAIGMTG